MNDVDTLSDYTLQVAQGDASYDAICSELEAATGARRVFHPCDWPRKVWWAPSASWMRGAKERLLPSSTPVWTTSTSGAGQQSIFKQLRTAQARLAELEG